MGDENEEGKNFEDNIQLSDVFLNKDFDLEEKLWKCSGSQF